MSPFDAHTPLLPEIIALHGKWRGAKTALIFGDKSLNWAEFNAETNRLASALNARGIAAGAMVGIVMSNGSDMVTSLVGLMKSGACSVPINLSVSDAALYAMLEDASVKAVIATADQVNRLDGYLKAHPDVMLFTAGATGDGSLDALKASGNPAATFPAPAADAPLNIIYSSGTTGMPKGIIHTHGVRLAWATDLALALRYDNSCRTLFTIGLYSNISWVALLSTLLVGGTMIVHDHFDPVHVLKTIEGDGITNFAMVPIQYQRLMEVPGNARYDLSSIKAVMSCGSPLHADLKAALFKRFGPKVIELYGLTEGLITTLEPEEAEGRLSSVGKPLVGTDIKIVGDDDREVAAGTPGEIVGRSRIVMPGYLNRTDATEEACWRDESGSGWLRTGDIGQLDDEGYLYIVDRKKDMILSGGQNIYPQDIEAVLIRHEDVNDVAVIGVPSKRWGETPLAVIVPENGRTVDTDALKAWTNERLGKQQRIAGVVLTDALPRNPNGKILKRDLRESYGGKDYG